MISISTMFSINVSAHFSIRENINITVTATHVM